MTCQDFQIRLRLPHPIFVTFYIAVEVTNPFPVF